MFFKNELFTICAIVIVLKPKVLENINSNVFL